MRRSPSWRHAAQSRRLTGEAVPPQGLDDPRRRGAIARAVPRIAPAMAVAAALWITFASVLVGGPGARWPVWLGAVAAPLTILLWVGAGLQRWDSRRHLQRAARPLTAWTAVVTWCLAGVLGLLLPDVVDGRVRSVFSALVPGVTPGLTWGFANTLGVLTFAAAAAGVIASALDVRRTRRLLRGERLTVDPTEEDRLREQWVESFR